MRRPSITTPCVADTFHGDGERIAEITFSDGRGALLSVRERATVPINPDRLSPVIELYRVDPGVIVRSRLVLMGEDSEHGPGSLPLSLVLQRAFLYNNQGFHEPPDWRAFDRIEVQAVAHYRDDDETGQREGGYYEPTSDDNTSPDMWSVYGHYRGGGVTCLSDISGGGPAQAEAARELARMFEGFIAECAGYGEIPREQWDPHGIAHMKTEDTTA